MLAVSEELPEEKLAYYIDIKYLVSFNEKRIEIERPEKILEACLHEAFHSYEYRLLDLYEASDSQYYDLLIFKRAEMYSYEMKNYISGNDDISFAYYYNQQMEIDAREYSAKRVKEYLNEIEEYPFVPDPFTELSVTN